jgi:hypothetical protein
MHVEVEGIRLRFDLGRLVEDFRRVGGDEVAATVARVYGGDSLSVTAEEWDRCWPLLTEFVTTTG